MKIKFIRSKVTVSAGQWLQSDTAVPPTSLLYVFLGQGVGATEPAGPELQHVIKVINSWEWGLKSWDNYTCFT